MKEFQTKELLFCKSLFLEKKLAEKNEYKRIREMRKVSNYIY